MSHRSTIAAHLKEIYGEQTAQEVFPKFCEILDRYQSHPVIEQKRENASSHTLTEKDNVLITYANTITREGEKPLQTLKAFLDQYVDGAITAVHILPFFPSSSDGGFAVTDYYAVDPEFGNWEDIEAIEQDYTVMADLVLNHVSRQSQWFQKFLQGDPQYSDYFMTYDSDTDTSNVFQPRAHPLLTEVETNEGAKYVWTTFSPDQVDLNFRCPEVLLEMIGILLNLLSHGISIIRLDALAYVWDDPSTQSIHLPQTHAILKILRAVVDDVAPYSLLISETVFPFQENIEYLGTEQDESHMVTAFHLPPLVVDAFLQEDTTLLSRFFTERAASCKCPFFNLLATHDGIPLAGIDDYLPQNRLHDMGEILEGKGSFVSYKTINGETFPYEMNCTYFDAICSSEEDSEEAVQKFLAAHAIMFFIEGLPGTYLGSLLANHNDTQKVERTGIKRDINRSQYTWEEITKELDDPTHRRHLCAEGMKKLLTLRAQYSQFAPSKPQKILFEDSFLFMVERGESDEKITVIINVSKQSVPLPKYKGQKDLLSEQEFDGEVAGYGFLLLT